MTTPQARGWGNPDDRDFRQKNIEQIEAGGVTLLVNKRVAPIFVAFISELVGSRRYNLDRVRDDWGYANRCIRGTGPGTGKPCVKSNHSWGLAIDLNSTDNPMGYKLITNMPPDIRALAAKYNLMWGGSYANRKDPMHFEFLGTPYEADIVVHHLSQGTIQPLPLPAIALQEDWMALRTYQENGTGPEIAFIPGRGAHQLNADEKNWMIQMGLIQNAPPLPLAPNDARRWFGDPTPSE